MTLLKNSLLLFKDSTQNDNNCFLWFLFSQDQDIQVFYIAISLFLKLFKMQTINSLYVYGGVDIAAEGTLETLHCL